MPINKKNVSIVLVTFLFTITSLFFLFIFPSFISKADEDVTPPEVVSLSFDTNTIDTDDVSVDVTATINVTDDITGVDDSFSIRMVPTGGDNSLNQMVDFNFTLISGDEFDGVYESTATFPQYSATGDWVVYGISLADQIGNYSDMDQAAIVLAFGEENMTITNTALVGDNEVPEITSFVIPEAYREINTEENSELVVIELTVEDDLIGVELGGVLVRMMPEFDGENTGQGGYMDVEVTQDNGLSKDYEASITLPVGSLNGYWDVESIVVTDAFGNGVEYAASADDISTAFGVENSRINNVATIYDGTGPSVKSFSVTPSEFDTSDGDVELTVDVTIVDDMAGVDEDAIVWFRYSPLIGTQSQDATMVLETQVSDLEARYTGIITVPQYSKMGIWELAFDPSDIIGNVETFYADDILEDDPDAEGVILINTAITDEVTIERAWTIESSDLSVTFPEGTVVTKDDSGSFAFYRMISVMYDISGSSTIGDVIDVVNAGPGEVASLFETEYECDISEGCLDTVVTDTGFEGDPVGVLRAGIPGLNIEFSSPVEISIHNLEDYDQYVLSLQTFQEGGDSWSNEDYCTVTDGDCTFTVNHASFFGASVYSIPDSEEYGGDISDTDKNYDGIPDDLQPYVSYLISDISNEYVVLEVLEGEGSEFSNFSVDPFSSFDFSDEGYDYSLGLISFQLDFLWFPDLDEGAQTKTIRAYFYGEYDDSFALVKKFNTVTNEIVEIPGATAVSTVLEGNDVLIVTFDIEDGGDFDMDGEVNGTIIDPFGVGYPHAGVPNTGYGGLSNSWLKSCIEWLR